MARDSISDRLARWRSPSSRRSSRCSSSARASPSSASSSRTSRGAGSAASPRVARRRRPLAALCHVGANLVPSGEGCGAFAERRPRASGARMIIGEERAVGELWDAARGALPRAARRPARASPSTRSRSRRRRRRAACGRRARRSRAARPGLRGRAREELGVDPLARDPEGFRWRTRRRSTSGRSWLWVEDGVDPASRRRRRPGRRAPSRCSRSGSIPTVRGRGYGARGMRDLCRLLLERTPTVTPVRPAENAAAIGLYESIGMEHALEYRASSSEPLAHFG